MFPITTMMTVGNYQIQIHLVKGETLQSGRVGWIDVIYQTSHAETSRIGPGTDSEEIRTNETGFSSMRCSIEMRVVDPQVGWPVTCLLLDCCPNFPSLMGQCPAGARAAPMGKCDPPHSPDDTPPPFGVFKSPDHSELLGSESAC